MRRLTLLSSAALALFAVGCTSPEDVCKDEVKLRCEREFECNPNKGSNEFVAKFGTTKDNCLDIYAAARGCSDLKEMDDNCVSPADDKTPTGQKYDTGKGSDCRKAREDQSCSEYLAQYYSTSGAPVSGGIDTSKVPAVCNQVCTND